MRVFHTLRPVIQTGARVIDTVFADVGTDVSWAMDLSRPGVSGDLIPWKDAGHGTSLEVPAGAA